LDFYHLLEHLHEFSLECFTDNDQAKAWVERQKELLLKSKAPEGIQGIVALPVGGRKKKLKAKLPCVFKGQSRPHGLPALSNHRLWHHWFGSGGIRPPHRGAKTNETIGTTLEQARGWTPTQFKSHFHESAMG
jgi:hypothetical protein